MPMLSPSVGWGWMVLPMSTAVRTHLNGQGNLANHVARVGADDAAAQNAVAVGLWRHQTAAW